MSRALDRTIFAPVAAARPYLVFKGTLLLLAFDMWLTRAEHAGRYGAGGFNVAHFGALDAIQPSVSPGVYVGVCVLTGALCFAIVAASKPPRWLVALAFALHTWSWAMSMLDSYQHHYLLSIVLLAMIAFPQLTAEDAVAPPEEYEDAPDAKGKRRKKKLKGKSGAPKERRLRRPRLLGAFPTVTAWGYALMSWSVAIVYGYTAYAKTDPEWLSGAALRRVLRLPVDGSVPAGMDDPIGPFRSLMGAFGLEGDTFWWAMGHSVVLVQIICCAGYLLAPLRDVQRSWIVRAFYWVALFTALSFHAGAEYMGLKIGWFSWYMIGYALLFFLPGKWIAVAARGAIPLVGKRFGNEVLAVRIFVALGWIGMAAVRRSWVRGAIGIWLLVVTPLRLFAKTAWADAENDRHLHALALVTAGIGAITLVAVGYAIDLPGAPEATIVAAVGLGAAVVVLLITDGNAKRIHAYGVGATVGALALLASIALSDVRWDFYRNVGGDHRRRGEYVTAYIAYVKANRYAPEDDDRHEKEAELRDLLERRGDLPEVP